MRIERRQRGLSGAVDQLGLKQVAREDWALRLRVGRVLPGGDPADAQLAAEHDPDVDEAVVVALEDHDLVVAAAELLGVEVLQGGLVLDLLDEQHIGVEVKEALGDPLPFVRLLLGNQAAHEHPSTVVRALAHEKRDVLELGR
jgi:hypothetical protein